MATMNEHFSPLHRAAVCDELLYQLQRSDMQIAVMRALIRRGKSLDRIRRELLVLARSNMAAQQLRWNELGGKASS